VSLSGRFAHRSSGGAAFFEIGLSTIPGHC
jgi:hypothetical protein